MWEWDHKEGWVLWCCRRLLRDPSTERRSNKSILKEISPEYSLEGLMLKLKLHYFGHLMQRANSLKKTLMLGMIEGRRREQQSMRWLDDIIDSVGISVSQLQERLKDRKAWHTAVHGVTKSWTWMSNWTKTKTSAIDTILSLIFQLLCRATTEPPPGWGSFSPLPIDLKPREARRLVMLAPSYLTTKQSDVCLGADHVPKQLYLTQSLEAIPWNSWEGGGGSQVSWPKLSGLFAWSLQ